MEHQSQQISNVRIRVTFLISLIFIVHCLIFITLLKLDARPNWEAKAVGKEVKGDGKI